MSEWDDITASEIWDAGELGCGELVAHLRSRVKLLQPGQTLHLIARDAGAAEDIPAWCRVTGHSLKRNDPPHYLIQRKEE
jgi:tRNA 2-thiouridine synthesizing protein A